MKVLLSVSLLIFFFFSFLISYPSAVPFVRFVSVHNGDHFYTIHYQNTEYFKKIGYNCEGTLGWVYPSQIPKTIPIYRYLSNRGDHFYTTNVNEIGTSKPQQYGRYGYKFESIEGYCYPNNNGGKAIPVYRYFNGRDHFYTTSASEIGTTQIGKRGKLGYVYEGVLCYILPLNRPKININNEMLWNRYRVSLAYNLGNTFCNGKINCKSLEANYFQFINHPMTAEWNKDKKDLNKDFCYAPAEGSNFKPISTSYDGRVSEKYRKYLTTIGSSSDVKNAFIQFMKNQPSDQNECMPWEETGYKLKNWVDQITKTTSPNHISFQFHFDVEHADKHQNFWTNMNNYKGKTTFLRTVSSKTLSDNDNIVGLSDSNSNKVIHKYINKIQLLKGNKFDLTFKARAVTGISIKPSNSWFNEGLVNKYWKNSKKKPFSLLPRLVFVALNPQIEMTVSKSIYDQCKAQLNKNVGTWLVAGAQFHHKPTNKALLDLFPGFKIDNKKIKDFKFDTIQFKKVYPGGEEKEIDFEKEKETFFKKYLQKFNPFTFERENNQVMEDFFDYAVESDTERRRRRRYYVQTHTNLIPKVEGEYKIIFKSSSPIPQIIAVVNKQFK